MQKRHLLPYKVSLAGTLLAAREAVMAPIRPFLRASGVTDQQWRVLRVLTDSESMDPSRLAQAALLHASSVSRILKELLDRELIDRRHDPSDGRRSVVVLLPAGRALVDRTSLYTIAIIDSYGKRFGEERLSNLRRELVAFIAEIGGLDEYPFDDAVPD